MGIRRAHERALGVGEMKMTTNIGQ
jgi:hypothetical protein